MTNKGGLGEFSYGLLHQIQGQFNSVNFSCKASSCRLHVPNVASLHVACARIVVLVFSTRPVIDNVVGGGCNRSASDFAVLSSVKKRDFPIHNESARRASELSGQLVSQRNTHQSYLLGLQSCSSDLETSKK